MKISSDVRHETRHQENNKVSNNKMDSEDSGNLSVEGLTTVTQLKATSEVASQKHALSERKRRKRINNHFDSLRQLFPNLPKSDKASVLTETVRRLKELKRRSHEDGNRSFFIPGEKDEMSLSHCGGGNVRAMICCDERADLNQDLTEAIKLVGAKVVRAEMATVGKRRKVEVVVSGGGEEDVQLLRRELKAVVENNVLVRTHPVWPKVFNQFESNGLIMKT